jgi:hypothetical protein
MAATEEAGSHEARKEIWKAGRQETRHGDTKWMFDEVLYSIALGGFGRKKNAAFAGRAKVWCSREDSNLHGFPHMILSHTRLPIPPREQIQGRG